MATFDKTTKTWRAQVMIDKKYYRKRGFTSKRNADLWEANQRRKHEMNVLDLPVPDDVEIKDLFAKYIDHARREKKPKSAKRDQSCLNVWSNFFSDRYVKFVSEIKDSTGIEFKAWREKKVTARGNSPTVRTINLDIRTLKLVLKWAKRNKIISANPMSEVEVVIPKTKIAIPRYLSVEEVSKIEEAVGDSPLGHAFFVLVRTGMRSGELCSLDIKKVDASRQQILLLPEQTKSGYMRSIPLDEKTLARLEILRQGAKQQGREHLFATRSGSRQTTDNLNRRFRTVLNSMEKNGILENTGEVNIHTLRKTYISHMIMAGEDPVKVMSVVGHRDWSTMKRYLALSPKYLSEMASLPY